MSFAQINRNFNQKFITIAFCFGAVVTAAGLTASALSVGYKTNDADLKPGMVVRIDEVGSSQTVSRASKDDFGKIVGVTVAIEESNLALASEGQSVYVKQDGQVKVYVSNIYGEVKSGDLLTLSPLKGALAKVSASDQIIYATALEDLSSQENVKTAITGVDGFSGDVNSALMLVNLNSKGTTKADQSSESQLRQIGKSVLGKDVTELQLVLAFIIFIVIVVAEVAILYAAISNALSSMGRNPLAKKQIRKELLRVLAMAGVVLVVGLGVVYIVLSL